MPPYETHKGRQSVSGLTVSSHGVTDRGHFRAQNEDSILLLPEESIWVVADGMGGHHAGGFASQTITQNMSLFKQQSALEDSISLVEENLMHSNTIIREETLKLSTDVTIGSTVVAIYIWSKYIFAFWAGDSRLYRYRDKQLERLTEDHSYVEELVKMGKIEAKDAETHPAANVVLNAVGIEDDFRSDFNYFEIQDGDIYIICTDGLYKDLAEFKISKIIEQNSNDLVQLTQCLLRSSLDAGGSDNTSIISLKVSK